MDEYENPPFTLTVGIKYDQERSLVSAKGGRGERAEPREGYSVTMNLPCWPFSALVMM